MGLREEHCRDCVIALGEPFTQVHEWLDEFWPTLGPPHRFVRHHTAGIEEVRRMWGDRAAEAAAVHIRKDYYGQIPTEEESRMWAIMYGGGDAQQKQDRFQQSARKRRNRDADFLTLPLHPGIKPGPW